MFLICVFYVISVLPFVKNAISIFFLHNIGIDDFNISFPLNSCLELWVVMGYSKLLRTILN